MEKFILAIILIFTFCVNSFADMPQKSGSKGEHLKYVIRYGIIRGGKASLKLKPGKYKGNKVYHATLTGKTTGLFNTLYKVRDTYHTYIHPKTLLPVKAVRNIREGSYKRYNEVLFDREKNRVHSQRSGTKDVPEGIHDILSAFYYARANFFNSDLKEGELIKIRTYFADEQFLLQFRFMGYENIQSEIGEIKCYKFVPIVQTGRAFKDADDMTIWISADVNKIPVRVQFNLFIGALRCELVNFSDFPISSLLTK